MSGTDTEAIAARVAEVRDRIAAAARAAGRDPLAVRLVAATKTQPVEAVRAVVGPCVCAAHYEFGADALTALALRLGPEVVGATVDGAPAFDLRAAITGACTRAGVDSVDVVDVCTVKSPDHYSYRRDGVTGRHGVVVTLT